MNIQVGFVSLKIFNQLYIFGEIVGGWCGKKRDSLQNMHISEN